MVVLRALPEGVALGKVRALLELAHPNLVRAVGVTHHDGRAWLVQAAAPGPTLHSWAEAVSPRDVVLVGAAALRGLERLHHAGLVHGAITPQRIRVASGQLGGLPEARLVGVRLEPDSAPRELGANDIFDLGLCLYQVLLKFGRPDDDHPDGADTSWRPPTPKECRKQIHALSPQLWLLGEILGEMVRPRPSDRPTASLLLEQLAQVVERPLQITAEHLSTDYLPEPTLIGREEVLHHLDQTVQRVKQGPAQLTQIIGIGSTRVGRHSLHVARLRGFRVVRASNPAQLRESFPSPFEQGEAGLDKDQLAARLVDALFGVESSEPALSPTTNSPNGTPVAIWLDDWDRASPLATAFIAQLARVRHRLKQVWVLVTNDRHTTEIDTGVWECLSLPELSPRQVIELLADMLYHMPNLPPWATELHGLTNGNLRDIVELVRAQIEAGLPETLTLPQTRAELAKERLMRLPPRAQHLVSTVSLSPRPVPLTVLGSAQD